MAEASTQALASAPVRSLRSWRKDARRALSGSAWSFLEGGSGDETTLVENTQAFTHYRMAPYVLRGACNPQHSVLLYDYPNASPFILAPIGLQRLFHPDGETASMHAATQAGVTFALSTIASVSWETVQQAKPSNFWFQLYALRDEDRTIELIRRAEQAGATAILLTVDAPRIGLRWRDLDGQLVIPSEVRPLLLENVRVDVPMERHNTQSPIAAHAEAVFDASLTWHRVTKLRKATRLPFILKGILRADDARRAMDVGVSGVIVSNHGGRQSALAPASLHALSTVLESVDTCCDVYFDSGIRSGSDALVALAMGAKAVLIGRPYIWGLAAAGSNGVRGVLKSLTLELETEMALLGANSLEELRDLYAATHQKHSFSREEKR